MIAWIGRRATSRGQEDDATSGFYEACDILGYNFIQIPVFLPFPALNASGNLPASDAQERRYPAELQEQRWGYTLTDEQAKRIAAQPIVAEVASEAALWYGVGHN